MSTADRTEFVNRARDFIDFFRSYPLRISFAAHIPVGRRRYDNSVRALEAKFEVKCRENTTDRRLQTYVNIFH